MRIQAHGISAELLQALGWTLLHFIWQGAALAALLAMANAVCRRATTRYAFAVITLALMMAAPLVTFTSLIGQKYPAVRFGARGALAIAVKPVQGVSVTARPSAPPPETVAIQPAGVLWFVEAWLLGVLLLSLRTAGGLFLIERMRRNEVRPVAWELYEKCLALQRKMRLERVVEYCECLRLDAPAVLGWFRPVVVLPARALTGLSEEQIEMIIAHELAHIRRLDCFVNLFQIGMETLLFYHPAVWWVSQRIRKEREHCCDDQAVALCGNAVNYARALTLMEEWRTAPSLVMAANGSPVSQRVVRLLGLDGPAGRFRLAGMAVAVACLVGAMVAGNAFLGVARAAFGTTANINPAQDRSNSGLAREQGSNSVIVVRPAIRRFASTEQAKDKEKDQSAGNDAKKESYLDAMEAAGFKNLSADELIAMKIQGVTPVYVKEIHDLGMKPTAEQFIGMRVEGITPEYIREMRGMAATLSVDELIGMKVQGVTPEYLRAMQAIGFKPGADELIGMKVQGITPGYVKEMQAIGLVPDVAELIGMKVQGVTPDYVRAMEAAGLKPNVDELIGMQVQGVTPEYVKSLQDAGFQHMESFEIIGAKLQGITPEFIEKARKHGFQNLTMDKLIALKQAEVF
ncbi:MAG: hypothetical protein DMG38_24385 [Acidobacteria bacterium]|nr:MAG: hypothetical protein DMG38_24385 [Acidobacteriota bacterium]